MPNGIGRGEAWAVGAALCYAAQGLALRAAAVDVSPILGAVVMAGPTFLVAGSLIAASPGRRAQLRPSAPGFIGWHTVGLLALGAVISYAVGNTLWVVSMAVGGITVAAPATQSGAVWGAVLGLVVLREKLTSRMVKGILVFSVGMALLGVGRSLAEGAAPGWLPGLAAGLAAALCWSITNVVTRFVLLRGADRFVALGASITIGLISLNVSLLARGEAPLYAQTPLTTYIFLVLAGLLNVGAQVSLVSALGLAPLASVSMVTSAGGIIPPVLGALVFGDPLNAPMAVAVVIVIWGAIVVQFGRLKQDAEIPGAAP